MFSWIDYSNEFVFVLRKILTSDMFVALFRFAFVAVLFWLTCEAIKKLSTGGKNKPEQSEPK